MRPRVGAMSALYALAGAVLLMSGCGGGTDATIEVDGRAVTPGFFIGETASHGDLSIKVDSIRSIFFVCGDDNVFHSFAPPLRIEADGSFFGEFDHRGGTLTVTGLVVDDGRITGTISGDVRCEGTFEARRCNPSSQDCGDRDGDTIPDEVDPNVNVPEPTATATFTPGAGQHTPTPIPTITFTPGGGEATPTPTVTVTFTPGGGEPTVTPTPSTTPTPTLTPTIPGLTETPTPSPTATCSLSVTVSLAFPSLPAGKVVNAVVVTVDYPSTVSMPPAGDNQQVDSSRVSNQTGVNKGNFIAVDNDSTTSLKITFAPGFEPNPGPTPPANRPVQIPGGPFARMIFDCQGTPPNLNAFSCNPAPDASDGDGDIVQGATTCSFSSP